MTHFRYLLAHEIDGSDRSHLVDALEDEEFPVREVLGEAQMLAQIDAGELRFDVETEERLPWFTQAVEVLSVHLSEYIYGLEIAEDRDGDGKRQVEILKYIGRRGDVIAVPLTHTIEFPSGEISPGHEDVDWLAANWSALPRWAQDGFRIKFPELRRL